MTTRTRRMMLAMREFGITLTDIAEASGYSHTYVSKVCKDGRAVKKPLVRMGPSGSRIHSAHFKPKDEKFISDRDWKIYAAKAKGFSCPEIATTYMLSVVRVRQIVQRINQLGGKKP